MTESTSRNDQPFVVVVSRGLPSPSSPLLGCFELDQARALAAAGVRVVHAVLDVRSIRRFRRFGQHSQIDASGLPIEVLSLPLGALPTRLNDALMGRAWRALFDRIVRRHGRPDVVHAHFTPWGAAVAGHTPRTPDRPLVVVTEHSSKLTAASIDDDLRWLAGRACAADRVVAVSRSLATVLNSQFGVEATVIGNVIELSTFTPAPRADRAVDAPLRVISTGNLIARKRMDLLIDGFAGLLQQRPASLTIVGDGPERAALAAQIDRLGLTSVVTLHGAASRVELGQLYRQHDVFALISSHETFGVVYAEALAAGLPVVAPRIAGPDEFVDESVGEWTEPTPEAVAEALARVADRLPEIDPLLLRQRIATRFSAEAVASQLVDLYRSPRPN